MTGVREIRAAIDELVAEGVSLRQIEREVIDDAPLSEDSRDALWLYAWGCIERAGHGVAVPA